MNTMLRAAILLALPAAAFFFAGCHSNIQPLKPLQRVELWVPDDGSPAIQLTEPVNVPPPFPAVARDPDHTPPEADTQPTTQSEPLADVVPQDITTQPATVPSVAATEPAPTIAATEPNTPDATPSTQPLPPGKKVIKIIDPNQTARFVYKASYDNIWQKAQVLTSRMGFILARRDYRLGVLTTQPLPSSQFIEFWKPQHASVTNAMENTVNNQRRSVRLTISQVPGKPDFYQIAIQVLVERETNPSELLATTVQFVEGSGFGRNAITLRSDYATIEPQAPVWIPLGHDPRLEKKLLDELFLRI